MSKMDNTKQRVYKIMNVLIESGDCEIKISFADLKDDTTIEEIGLNSISYIQLIVSIEDEFDIEFDDAMLDYNTIKIFADIIKVVDDKVN